jgi:hypothetical protein
MERTAETATGFAEHVLRLVHGATRVWEFPQAPLRELGVRGIELSSDIYSGEKATPNRIGHDI